MAVEFQNTHLCCSESAFSHLARDIEKKVWEIANTKGTNKVENKSGGEQEQNNNRKRLTITKKNTFTLEEVVRIKRALSNGEDIGTVAKEMGRPYNSVQKKIYTLRNSVGLRKGKFSAEEIKRMQQGLENNEDYKSTAEDLRRTPQSVQHKMLKLSMKCNLETAGKRRSFTKYYQDRAIP